MLNILAFEGKRGARCLCVVCMKEFSTPDRFISKKVLAGDQCLDCKNLPKQAPTQALLHQVYNYNAATGELTYKRDFFRRVQGEDACSTTNNGYLVVTLDKTYLAHRIIWLMQTGEFPEYVDHKNHNRTDNSWSNLTNVSFQENTQNKSVNTNNTSGFLGVSYMKALDKFRATITVNRKNIHIGVFDSAEQANEARIKANAEHGFHENHGTT